MSPDRYSSSVGRRGLGFLFAAFGNPSSMFGIPQVENRFHETHAIGRTGGRTNGHRYGVVGTDFWSAKWVTHIGPSDVRGLKGKSDTCALSSVIKG